MATESPVRLIGTSGGRNWAISKDTATFTSPSSNVAAQELGLLLQGHTFHDNRKFTGPNRSGSAPPSMEGSSLAVGDLRSQQSSSLDGIFENLSNTFESEEQLRADPTYLAYYIANVNLNPRLPPPLISRENRRLVHHIGGFGDNWRMPSFDDSSKGSSFMSRSALSTHKEESEDDKSPRLDSNDRGEANSGLVSMRHSSPSQGRHKSLVDLIQEDFPRTPSPVYNNQSRPSSHGVSEKAADADACINALPDTPMNITKAELKVTSVGVHARTPVQGVQSLGSKPNDDIAVSDRTMSPMSIKARQKGDSSSADAVLDNGLASGGLSGSNIGHLENETKNLKISNDGHRSQHARQHPHQNGLPQRGSSFQVQIGQSQMLPQGMPQSNNAVDLLSQGHSKLPAVEVPSVLQSSGIAPQLYATAATYGSPYYPNLQPSSLFPPQFGVGGYALNTSLLPPFITYPPYSAIAMPFENPTNPNFAARTSGVSTGGSINSGTDLQQFYKYYGQFGVASQPSFPDPAYVPYFQHPSIDAFAGAGQYDPSLSRGNTIGSAPTNYDPQKAPLPAPYSPDQRPQLLRTGTVNTPGGRKGTNPSPSYYGSPPNAGVLMQYPTSPLPSPVFQGSPVGGTSLRRNESLRSPNSSGRTGGAYSGWQGQRGREKVDDPKSHSFLEELRSSKSRRYELSDIVGRIVEFSADQHGSRFIQQKLETCSAEEKASVFNEVLPHASTLMTDVFGNYVIQKFFEHGSSEQRKELANQLVGHILPLSIQMYGCRVIQKALEVIELDQKTKLVHELDGHVMRCVRDQNGNHVIQKCIECVPTEKIGFIISAFRGQVASLSTHPYGCRVIQRVLEHCTDELQSQCIVDEILQSTCVLAQDQYGNYVTQHVLERGRPLERSQIISKLAGQIVQMSQHKFASNVIEKCLQHGNAAERELLIGEIVGQTEGNDNLLVMMKDQYANYVVQKIIETCSDKQRDILFSRIKVHLQALKKYTYGKHIVARVEQLCGEEIQVSES